MSKVSRPFQDPTAMYTLRSWEHEEDDEVEFDSIVFLEDPDGRELQLIYHSPDAMMVMSQLYQQAAQLFAASVADGQLPPGANDLAASELENPTLEGLYGITDENIQAMIAEQGENE